jgi:hypothetical protein
MYVQSNHDHFPGLKKQHLDTLNITAVIINLWVGNSTHSYFDNIAVKVQNFVAVAATDAYLLRGRMRV